MRRVLIGLLGLVCVAGLVAALSGLLAPQDRAYSVADVQNQRATLAGRTILVEASLYAGGGVGRWPLSSTAQPADLLHPPRGASAILLLVPPGMDGRRVTGSSGLWASPQASPPLPRHLSLTGALHSLPVVGHLFSDAADLGRLRHWHLTLLPRRGRVCGLFVINSPNPTPRPTTYCNEAVILDAY